MSHDDANSAYGPSIYPMTVPDVQSQTVPDWASLILESIDEVLYSLDRNWCFTYLNHQATVLWKRPREALMGQNLWVVFPVLLGSPFEQIYRQAMDESRPGQIEALSPVTGLWYLVRAYPIPQGLIVAFHDITARKQAEAALRATQAQLLQSQKMESVGQLAGGIAHDFNNLLNVMLGFCQLGMSNVQKTDPIYEDLHEIQQAGDRAAALVRQLLAFSRKQVLEPRVVDLNATVANLDTLLRRVLGAEIALQTLLDPQLAPVLVDVGQIEQVIVNIAINARDAMPDGGHLTIETANVILDEVYQAAGHPEVQPGAYVMLALHDTGHGMDQATQAKIFEPFFTTKEEGRGTGLGLATTYGIVRQSGGTISVASEVGLGTAFRIYLPSITE